MKDLKDIAAEALGLPLTARAELASQLLDSLDDLSEEETDQLWAQEAERRYAEYEAGNIDEAVAYFDQQRPGLGDRFEQDLLATVNLVTEHPFS